jgi:dTDP-4-amino-4,6-dideoxygalactose transaminase
MIKLASPDIREEDIRRASAVLRSNNLVQGENVSRLEEDLVKFSGIAHCGVVSSGTAALHLALRALGISQGDAVIVPAFTFPATANVVINVGAEVLLCEVSRDSYVVTPELIETAIAQTPHGELKGIIIVHEFGYPADMRSIRKIAGHYGLKLIEDAACALGTQTESHHPGYYSDAACFSFHPRKAITTGEGGAVLSNDKTIVDRIKNLRNHGINYTDQGPDFTEAGLNYRMTDFQAALAVGQLARFSAELSKRKKLAELYSETLASTPGVHLPQSSPGHSWQSFMVVLDKAIDRNSVIRAMAQKGIETNLGAQALHLLTYYKDTYGYDGTAFKTAADLYRNGLALPLYGKLQPADITYISQTLKGVLHEF